MKNKRKRFLSVFIVSLMVFSLLVCGGMDLRRDSWLTGLLTEVVYATASEEKVEKEEAEEKLDEVNDKLEDLESESSAVSQQIGNTQTEINNMISALEDVQGQIADKQAEIDQCALDLQAAEDTADQEYESMKLRIQYMYENSSSGSIWTAIVESDGISDFLNRVEYINTMYESDRRLLTSYQDAVAAIEGVQDKLTGDMEELTALQDSYTSQKEALEEKMASLESQQSEYAAEIARYQSLASQYQTTIATLAAAIQTAEEAAEQRAAADRARTGNSGSSGTDGNYNPSGTTGVSGDAIVAYALQFVGNPYVWAGNSLTEGCDCSGFVHLIYAHFGISTPRYSQAFLNYGQKVSYNNLQAGDVVVYPGHVAIYMSNGCIVEAQCKAAGITKYRSVNCHPITGIRRYV